MNNIKFYENMFVFKYRSKYQCVIGYLGDY